MDTGTTIAIAISLALIIFYIASLWIIFAKANRISWHLLGQATPIIRLSRPEFFRIYSGPGGDRSGAFSGLVSMICDTADSGRLSPRGRIKPRRYAAAGGCPH